MLRPKQNQISIYSPNEWKGYDLKVKEKYENDKWLTYQNTPGEWWIAYHGLRNPKVSKNIINEGFIENDLNQ